jgi:branched-chain amino acid transport system substrate-binding protein
MTSSGTIRVGMVWDFQMPESSLRPFRDAFQLALDEGLENGLIDRPVEIISREVAGLPKGNVHDVLKAWKEVADEGVVCIFGPGVSDNAIGIRRYIEEQGRIPSIGWVGTDRWYGEYCFNINSGSLPEDPYLMANYLAIKGVNTVAVAHDRSAIGEEYRAFFREACEFEGLRVVSEEGLGQVQTDVLGAMERARAAQPDALAYLGFGYPAVQMNKALEEIGWDPIRVMNTSFLTAPLLPEGLESLKGWIGCDQYDEENRVGQDVLDRFEKRYGYRPQNYLSLMSYDTANVIVHALSKAHPLSPEGVKVGLEKVKMLPAATGGPGGVFSFGPYLRRGWLSPTFIVMREVDPELTGEITLMGAPGTVLRHRLEPRTETERMATRARNRLAR